MIIQCEECKTNFNLDEKRLRGDSAKVRCSKCKHVFMIYKEQEQTATAPLDNLFGESMPAIAAEETATTSTFAESSAFDANIFAEPSEEPITATFDTLSAAAETTTLAMAESTVSDDFAFSDMSFETTPEPAAPVMTDDMPAAEPAASTTPAAFNDDLLSFADVAPSDEDLATPPVNAAQEVTPTATTDTDASSFDFDFGGADEATESKAPVEEFDHGGFDFSVPTPEPATATAAAAPAVEPFTFAADTESASTYVPVPSADDSEESFFSVYRPFAIAGICATAIITVLTAGYFMVKGSPGNLERMGIANVATAGEKEQGSFIISNAKAAFVKNKVDGELFMVSGTATNSYKVPRTGVEVQVTLFNAKGEELTTKTAFCGSTIDNEQVATMSLANIDAELTKEPSDDPLENTPVEPGKATECLVVFKGVPKDATVYGIEVTHSKGEKLDDF